MNPLLAVSLLFSLRPVSATEDLILSPGRRLEQGQTVSNGNGSCQLVLQRDGNLIVKRDGSNAWSSGTRSAYENQGPFFLKLNTSGTLVVKTTDSGDVVFITDTRGMTLNEEQGGLFFNPDCSIYIQANDIMGFIWTNINRCFYCGNVLERNEMFRYPSSDPTYTLLLQNDGNLIVFEGIDLVDYNSSHDVIWGAGAISSSDDFYFRLTCDGQLVLKEKIGDAYVTYWSMSIIESDGEFVGNIYDYSLTLNESTPFGPFGYSRTDADDYNA